MRIIVFIGLLKLFSIDAVGVSGRPVENNYAQNSCCFYVTVWPEQSGCVKVDYPSFFFNLFGAEKKAGGIRFSWCDLFTSIMLQVCTAFPPISNTCTVVPLLHSP